MNVDNIKVTSSMSLSAGTVSAGMSAEQPRGCLHASDSMCCYISCQWIRNACANRLTRRRPRQIPETDLFPEVTIIAEETLSKANVAESAAQGTVPLTAVASGMSLATANGANLTVVEDAPSVVVEGTAAQAAVEQSTRRPSLPRACKKSRTPQVQLTGKPKGKPKPPSERKLVPATEEATPVVPASGTRVVEGQSTRASLPRACKMTANTKPEDTPPELPSEKKPSSEKPEKKPSDYQSAVARHLAKTKGVHSLTMTIRFVSSVFVR